MCGTTFVVKFVEKLMIEVNVRNQKVNIKWIVCGFGEYLSSRNGRVTKKKHNAIEKHSKCFLVKKINLTAVIIHRRPSEQTFLVDIHHLLKLSFYFTLDGTYSLLARSFVASYQSLTVKGPMPQKLFPHT